MNQKPPRAKRIRCTVEYDGTPFAGWQLQPVVPTVQGTIEAALSRLFDSPVRISAAVRKDSGVNATAQEIAFDAPASWTPDSLLTSLSAVLPTEIGIVEVRETDPEFHPRFSATGRRYEYFVGDLAPAVSPLRAGRIWQLGHPVPIASLRSVQATSRHCPGRASPNEGRGARSRGRRGFELPSAICGSRSWRTVFSIGWYATSSPF